MFRTCSRPTRVMQGGSGGCWVTATGQDAPCRGLLPGCRLSGTEQRCFRRKTVRRRRETDKLHEVPALRSAEMQERGGCRGLLRMSVIASARANGVEPVA